MTPGANVVYNEVDSLEILLRYRTQNAGPCKIVLHPEWGSSIYPASLFAKAPLNIIIQAIHTVEGRDIVFDPHTAETESPSHT